MAFALNLPKLVGGGTGGDAAASRAPTFTQAPAIDAAQGYDPLASGSLIEQVRSAMADARVPRKVPLIGHLPMARQFHVLGIMLVTFAVFAAFIMSIDVRTAAQGAASVATATEMQMLSQRLASGSTLALLGRPVGFEAVKDSRERFKTDLDALQRGGTVKGVALDAVQDDELHMLLQGIKARWDRIDPSVEQ